MSMVDDYEMMKPEEFLDTYEFDYSELETLIEESENDKQ